MSKKGGDMAAPLETSAVIPLPYAALARAAASDSATPQERQEYSQALGEHHERLTRWADYCSESFANRAALVGAEIARLDGRELEAERLYEQAIHAAREQGFVQTEGLAYELAARFYAARGFEAFADLYLRRARHCYQRWGADGNVRQLLEQYPRLMGSETALESRGTTNAPVQQSELATVLLYLESNLAPRVFGPSRIAVLKLLASQAAMSLENTRLYRDLAKREAQIRRLVDANIVGIVIWDFDGTILDGNDAFLRMVGYEREDLASGRLRWTDLTPAQRLGRDRQDIIAELQRTGSVQPFEWEYFHKDGGRVPVLIGAASFEGENQGVAFVLDLTERKRAEDARTHAEAELQQARKALAHRQRISMLGEVAASLTHEIRQPIAAAHIDAKVCLRALADERLDLEAAREAADRMLNDAARADEIIKRTTALYKKDTTHRQRVNINAVIREMAVLLRQEAGASTVAIRIALTEGLPEVIADRVQLQQVLMNLMLNAIDAMKDAGGELTITSQMSDESELLIAVSDTGVGLPADNPGQIFESFVTTKPHGTGMGLAITRSIVESHGGRLWATANTGPGATFLFTLLTDAGERLESEPR
jgi:PAS domain S-box-containing protein